MTDRRSHPARHLHEISQYMPVGRQGAKKEGRYTFRHSARSRIRRIRKWGYRTYSAVPFLSFPFSRRPHENRTSRPLRIFLHFLTLHRLLQTRVTMSGYANILPILQTMAAVICLGGALLLLLRGRDSRSRRMRQPLCRYGDLSMRRASRGRSWEIRT